MAIKALSVDKVKQYQSELDPEKGQEGATTFTIKALTARQAAKIRDKSTKIGTEGDTKEPFVTMEMNKANIEFVKYGVKGWTNLRDEEDKLVPCELVKDGDGVDCLSDKCIDFLSPDLIQELANQISGFNSLSEGERKN